MDCAVHILSSFFEIVETVEVRDLHKELTTVADVWLPLGLHLEIPIHVLRGIESDRSGSVDDCLISMLEWWEKNKKPSWSKVVQALCTVNRKECAWKITTKYSQLSIMNRRSMSFNCYVRY